MVGVAHVVDAPCVPSDGVSVCAFLVLLLLKGVHDRLKIYGVSVNSLRPTLKVQA